METVKCAVVTGASSGIGQGIAIVLARHGYDVAITYGQNPDGARSTQAQIQALGRRCFYYQADMNDADAPARVVNQAHRDLGRIDTLVCNAGRTRHYSVLDVTAAQLDDLYQLNYRSYVLCAGAAARHMVADKIEGSIFFITSSRGARAYPEDFHYGGLKSALQRACESMALDLSPYKIRVNCVAPGATRVRELPAGQSDYPWVDFIPLGRSGTPQENGELIAFLASENATYITGVTVRVDGGLILPGFHEGWDNRWLNPEWTQQHYEGAMKRLKEENHE
jgi:glucose 1-dehydrogenase